MLASLLFFVPAPFFVPVLVLILVAVLVLIIIPVFVLILLPVLVLIVVSVQDRHGMCCGRAACVLQRQGL